MPNARGYRPQTWLLVGALTVVAGCSAGGPPTLTAQQATSGQAQATTAPADQDPLGLTDKQKQQLAQTMQSMRPSEAQQQVMRQIQQQLLAADVDVPKLTAALEASRQALVQSLDKVVGLFQGLRQILDDSQRQTLISLLQQVQQDVTQPDFPSELHLNDQQKQALLALRPDEKRLNRTFVDFLRSGDANTLRQAMAADMAAMPQPATIATALAGLTHDQRQTMFSSQQP